MLIKSKNLWDKLREQGLLLTCLSCSSHVQRSWVLGLRIFRALSRGRGGGEYSQSRGICIDEMSKMLAVTSGLRQKQVKGQELLTCFNLFQPWTVII